MRTVMSDPVSEDTSLLPLNGFTPLSSFETQYLLRWRPQTATKSHPGSLSISNHLVKNFSPSSDCPSPRKPDFLANPLIEYRQAGASLASSERKLQQ